MTVDRLRRKRSAVGLGSVAVRMRNQSPAGTKFQAQGTSPHSRKLWGAVRATEHGRLLGQILDVNPEFSTAQAEPGNEKTGKKGTVNK